MLLNGEAIKASSHTYTGVYRFTRTGIPQHLLASPRPASPASSSPKRCQHTCVPPRRPRAQRASMALPCAPATTRSSYYHLGFAMQGRMNAQYGSFLPVACFPGARGAIAWPTLDTVMRRALSGHSSALRPPCSAGLVGLV